MGRVIGIDLGTTNSCVAVMEGGVPKVIPNNEGYRTTPSVVAFSKDGHRLVGDVAKRQAAVNADRTMFSIKRHMGTDYRKKIDGKHYTPQEISAFILTKLKSDAESYLGEEVTDAVITVPAYFNDAGRQATKDAGRIAGLNVLRIINEPTSAALAYGLDNGQPQKILVYDLGGGTFDVSIIEIGDRVIEVLATSGDNHLGGWDFDNAIAKWIVDEFKKLETIDLSNDSMAMQRIIEEAEKAKCALSTTPTYNINLPFIAADTTGPKHLTLELTKSKFEQIVSEIVDRLNASVAELLKDANCNIDEVVLVGGSCRMPLIQEKIKQLFSKEPSKNANLDTVVAEGAAIQASIMSGENVGTDVLLLDVTPLNIGIETNGEIFTTLIEKNTTVPAKRSQVFTTAVDNQPAVTIRIATGNRPMFADNKLIGTFNLDGIPPAPRGVPQIEITVEVDANNII